MRVIGVDPGLHRTGVAVVEGSIGALTLVHAECIEIAAGAPDAERLALLFARLEAMIAAHGPEVASVEQLFFASNRTTAFRVSQARGVALCALARASLAVHEYTPPQVKESVTGWGGAAKAQVAAMTMNLLGVDTIPGPDDVADACAVAVCHHHRAPLSAHVRGVAQRAVASSRTTPALAAAIAAARERQAGPPPGGRR